MTRRISRRPPARGTGDAVGLAHFFSAGPSTTGRPVVLVHKGDRTRVRAGARVHVGPDVEMLVGGNHRIDWVSAFAVREVFDLPGAYERNPWSAGDIILGDDAVVGRGARILSGVSVGTGAVILPHSVVTRDVAPGTVVGGHPAQPVTTVPLRSEDMKVTAPQATATSITWRVRRLSARVLRHNADRLDGGTLGPLPAIVDPPVDPPPVEMGTASYFQPLVRCEPGADARVTIGNYASVSYDTECVFSGLGPLTGGTPEVVRTVVHGDAPRPQHIIIGHDVWVTRGTKVFAGVHIGDGAVVAAYSVVTEDVRPYAIVAGNPAREIARRFDDSTVEALLRIKWWEWPETEIRRRADELCSSDVAAFVRLHDPAPRPPGLADGA